MSIASATAPVAARGLRYQPLVWVLGAMCAGIFVDRNGSIGFSVWCIAGFAAWLGWLGLHYFKRDQAASIALGICLAASAGGWHHSQWDLFPDDDLGRFAGVETQPVCIEAVAVGNARLVPAPPPEPMSASPAGDRTRLDVVITAIRNRTTWRSARGNCILRVDGLLEGVHVGDRMRIVALLSAPAPPSNPGEFDYELHARADRIRSYLWAESPDCIRVVERGNAWTVGRFLEHLRSRGNTLLWNHLASPRSGLATALLLGTREQLDYQRTTAFFETGTIHLLSISGLHIGILASYLFWALRLGLLRRTLALAAVSLVTVVYTIVIDADPPAIRATILVVLICLGMYLGRPALAWNLLAAAGIVVLILNPADLFRSGPQLSFLAVAVLAWFGPEWKRWQTRDRLENLIARTRPWPVKAMRWIGRWAWRATLVSMYVWLVTLPLLVYLFQIASPISLLLTPILSLPVALGLMSGFGVLVLGWFAPPLAAVCGWICDGCLWALEVCVAQANRLPFNHAWCPGPALWWVIGFYLLLAALIVWPGRNVPRRWRYALFAVWTAVGFASAFTRSHREGDLDCTFLAVGHGCAVVVEFPDGRILLYDAGQLGPPAVGARIVSAYLWQHGIHRLDAVMVSHADIDHYNAIPELLRRFSVDVIYATPKTLADDGLAMQTLLAAVHKARVSVTEVWEGQPVAAADQCPLTLIHPPATGLAGSDNAHSLVLAVEYQGKRILLTGDLEAPGMDRLLKQTKLDCDVALAPHHGSTRSNPPGFAAWSTPDWVVISGGHGRDYVPVQQAYLKSGAKVLQTTEDGAVRVSITGGKVRVWRWKQLGGRSNGWQEVK